MNFRFSVWLALALCATAAPALGASDARAPENACQDLYRLTDVDHAVEPGVVMPATDDVPAHCRVRGVIDGTIGFQVTMPVEGWRERLMFHAVGGTAGVLGDTGSLLSKGFAMATTDTGHKSVTTQGSEFARDDNALINFGFRAIHLTTVLAKRLVAAFYGREVRYSYITGCSNGGRAALVEALRYPEDFDGVIAGAPASGWGREIVPWGVAAHRKQRANPLDEASLALLDANSKQACDALDGLADGIVGNPTQCTLDVLNLEGLECTGGETSGCLTAGQIDTARFLYTGVVDDEGRVLSPGVLPGAEAAGEWQIWVTGNPAFLALPGHEGMGGIVRDLFHRKPGFDLERFDPVTDRVELAEASVSVELPEPDFGAFRAGGGKLLIYQGWQDVPCRALELLNYVSRAEALSGGREGMAEFSRIYMVPGMLHCVAGPGAWAADYVQPMVDWVEQGRPPERLVAHQPGIVDWLDAFGAVASGQVDWYPRAMQAGAGKADARRFSRPLCPFPERARYTGSGDPDDAASFTCVAD